MKDRIGQRKTRRLCSAALAFHLAALLLAPSCSDERAPRPSEPQEEAAERREERGAILFLGDSLTAGYGLDPELAYPMLIQARLDERGLDYEAIQAGVSGDTTSSGLRRLDWLLKRKIDVLVIALGGNDGLRGIDLPTVEQNLDAMIAKARARHPDVRIVLAGMQSPPSMGKTFTEPFRDIFPRVAKRNQAALVPFLLEGVGGETAMNQRDGIHPNQAGQERVADNVWAVLEGVVTDLEEEV